MNNLQIFQIDHIFNNTPWHFFWILFSYEDVEYCCALKKYLFEQGLPKFFSKLKFVLININNFLNKSN